MAMKLTNKKILNNAMTISNITNKELPVKVSYALAKNISKLEKELQIYNKEREKLIEKYSIKDDDDKTVIDENNQIKIQDKYLEKWNKDIEDLQNIEVEIDIHKFKLEELNGYNMTPAELIAIEYMIEE